MSVDGRELQETNIIHTWTTNEWVATLVYGEMQQNWIDAACVMLFEMSVYWCPSWGGWSRVGDWVTVIKENY